MQGWQKTQKNKGKVCRHLKECRDGRRFRRIQVILRAKKDAGKAEYSEKCRKGLASLKRMQGWLRAQKNA